jgi:hypothetical protein
MALSASTIANLMDSKAQQAYPLPDGPARDGRKAMFTAVAEAIVEHFVAAATVAVPGTGLLAPPGTAGGPVTGAAVGSIS